MQQVHVIFSTGLPDWIPDAARIYLDHTQAGVPVRALARHSGIHASTILRQIRRQEVKRDDPLVDEALQSIESKYISKSEGGHRFQEPPPMLSDQPVRSSEENPRIVTEAKRILRRLCETGAFLAVAPGVEQAVVFRETADKNLSRIAVVARDVASAFALKDWIVGHRAGKVGKYVITGPGRAALKRILAEEGAAKRGSENSGELARPFAEQHQVKGERWIMSEAAGRLQKIVTNLAESPITALGRKRGLDGAPFLSSAMIQAGERLREDFEIAQLGPRITQNWDRFLTASVRQAYEPLDMDDRPSAARNRVAAALAELGPGLADVAFRCCCFLEGLETAEKRLNWSARSGKVVLRIALGRLALHYEIGPMKRLREAA